VEDPRKRQDAPKLDEDFSKYFLINNLPKCNEAKSKKLIELLIKLYQKKSYTIDPEKITMPLNDEGMTEGVAFVVASSEEQAKLGAAIINDYQLDKSHLLSASQITDFEKIMQTSDSVEETASSYSLMDLRDPLLDTKHEHFLYQLGKDVHIKFHDANLTSPAECSLIPHTLQSDKNVQWSPKGTYLIIIKHDKVEFHGGKKMMPIITIPEQKVDFVSMSPCERYLLTYAPMSKNPYVIWNFQLVE
jgi:translation initiation factor 3 subunit B